MFLCVGCLDGLRGGEEPHRGRPASLLIRYVTHGWTLYAKPTSGTPCTASLPCGSYLLLLARSVLWTHLPCGLAFFPGSVGKLPARRADGWQAPVNCRQCWQPRQSDDKVLAMRGSGGGIGCPTSEATRRGGQSGLGPGNRGRLPGNDRRLAGVVARLFE